MFKAVLAIAACRRHAEARHSALVKAVLPIAACRWHAEARHSALVKAVLPIAACRWHAELRHSALEDNFDRSIRLSIVHSRCHNARSCALLRHDQLFFCLLLGNELHLLLKRGVCRRRCPDAQALARLRCLVQVLLLTSRIVDDVEDLFPAAVQLRSDLVDRHTVKIIHPRRPARHSRSQHFTRSPSVVWPAHRPDWFAASARSGSSG